MGKRRANCWEFKKCGREPGGSMADERGICPAAVDPSFTGINAGKCAGRFCWAVAGTFCGGKVQGTFAEKRNSCMSCDFYKRVQAEEGTANLRTKFLQFVSFNGETSFFKELFFQHINAGTRFITQGEKGDAAYIIQRGSCMVLVEKNGVLHPTGHRGEGDIVGVTAILTGEPRAAHVEAETDMDVWVLSRKNFEDISNKDSDLLSFLTELVADRFDSKRPTADRTIGKYLATDIIGRGGYSIVYKGIHTGLNLPVAMKMMRHDLAANPDFIAHFRNEAKIIASLSHENIIKVFDIEERFQTIFIIMEYLEGEALENLICRLKVIPSSLAASYLFQILGGLHCAHRIGIIHRDINPTNIFVERDDRIKILDFGLACPAGTEDFFFSGNPFYMAPEQILSEELDQRTDIFALGISAYRMVTGAHPFSETGLKKLMELHLHADIPDPAEKIPGIPPPLRSFIQKASRRNPKERYQNAKEALAELFPLVSPEFQNPRG